jgi:hypothetical protein
MLRENSKGIIIGILATLVLLAAIGGIMKATGVDPFVNHVTIVVPNGSTLGEVNYGANNTSINLEQPNTQGRQ